MVALPSSRFTAMSTGSPAAHDSAASLATAASASALLVSPCWTEPNARRRSPTRIPAASAGPPGATASQYANGFAFGSRKGMSGMSSSGSSSFSETNPSGAPSSSKGCHPSTGSFHKKVPPSKSSPCVEK